MSDPLPFEKPTEHINAPQRLRAKAARIRRKAVKALGPAPATLSAARACYLKFCESESVDLDLELQTIVDSIHEAAGRRLHRRRAP